MNQKLRKILSPLLVVCMIFTMLPLNVLAASIPDENTFDISEGAITIEDSGDQLKVSYGNNQSKTLNKTDEITLTGTAKSNDINIPNPNLITVKSSGTTNITIKDLNVTGLTPFAIQSNGTVNLTLVGDNLLHASSNSRNAGLFVPEGASLIIHGEGSLDALGYYGGAGIGGGANTTTESRDYTVNSGNITINSGTVTATGGNNAAGIGTGDNTNNDSNVILTCGTIHLNGGIINAKGGTGDTMSIGNGANRTGTPTSEGTINITGDAMININDKAMTRPVPTNATPINMNITLNDGRISDDIEETYNVSIGKNNFFPVKATSNKYKAVIKVPLSYTTLSNNQTLTITDNSGHTWTKEVTISENVEDSIGQPLYKTTLWFYNPSITSDITPVTSSVTQNDKQLNQIDKSNIVNFVAGNTITKVNDGVGKLELYLPANDKKTNLSVTAGNLNSGKAMIKDNQSIILNQNNNITMLDDGIIPLTNDLDLKNGDITFKPDKDNASKMQITYTSLDGKEITAQGLSWNAGYRIIQSEATTPSNHSIYVKNTGDNIPRITLAGINMKHTDSSVDLSNIDLTSAKAEIVLEGENKIEGIAAFKAPFHVSFNSSVWFDGTGTLTANNRFSASPATIGGNVGESNGSITVRSGNLKVNTNGFGAGIGGGDQSSAGTILIKGGTVNATTQYYGAAIGSGSRATTNNGNIIIEGGNVTAETNSKGAAIGSGSGATNLGGEIIINGGDVTTETNGYGAGIGGGYQSSAGTILIKGGTVNATTSNDGSAIGSGNGAKNNAKITIEGGNVTAETNSKGAAIGSGRGATNLGGEIIINGGDVTTETNGYGAGIGGGYQSSAGKIGIHGGTVHASSESNGAGIGSGSESGNTNGDITINGGEVNVKNHNLLRDDGGAGLGGGVDSAAGSIHIQKGIVYAYTTGGGAGIGGGDSATSNASITIDGGDVFSITEGYGAAIGSGRASFSNNGDITINGGKVTALTNYFSSSGIGGGTYSAAGKVTINGGSIHAEALVDEAIAIGGGSEGNKGTTTITGGSVFVSNQTSNSSRAASFTTDGSTPAYQTIVNLASVYGPNKKVTKPSLGSYGFNDVLTDDAGKIYLYLPVNDKTAATFEDIKYSGNVEKKDGNELNRQIIKTLGEVTDITDNSASVPVTVDIDATVYYAALESDHTTGEELEKAADKNFIKVSENIKTNISLKGLSPNKTYTYYFVAKLSDGTYSDVKACTFTTKKMILNGTPTAKGTYGQTLSKIIPFGDVRDSENNLVEGTWKFTDTYAGNIYPTGETAYTAVFTPKTNPENYEPLEVKDVTPVMEYLTTDEKAIVSPEANKDGWHNSDITLKAPTGFTISKVATLPGTWNTSIIQSDEANGGNLIYYLMNSEGLVAKKTFNFKLDKTSPVIGTLTYDSKASFLNWILGKDGLTITVPVTEDGSGVSKVDYVMTPENGIAQSLSANIENGKAIIKVSASWKGTIKINATDVAGNTSATKSVDKNQDGTSGGVIVENSAPVITVTDGNSLFTDEWYNAIKTISAQVKDSGVSSGIASITYTVDGGNTETLYDSPKAIESDKTGEITVLNGTHTYKIFAMDNVGNEAEIKTVTIKQDTVAPILSNVSIPTKENLSDTTAKISFTGNDTGNFYYLVKEDDNRPTVEDILNTGSMQVMSVDNQNKISLSGLKPKTVYKVFIVAKDKAGNPTADVTRVEFTTNKATIKGSIQFDHVKPKFQDTMHVDTTGITSEIVGVLSYKWYRDTAVINGATESSYQVTADDVGKMIKVEVSSVNYAGVLTTTSEAVLKVDPVVSAWPTAEAITYGQTLKDVLLSDGDTTNGTFAFSKPDTKPDASLKTQTFEVVFTPTNKDIYNVLTKDIPVLVKQAPRTIDAPTMSKKSDTTVTLDEVSLTKGDGKVQYGYSTSDVAPLKDDNVWQDSVTFSGLDCGSDYYFFSRVIESKNYQDVTSTSVKVTTDKTKLSKPTLIDSGIYGYTGSEIKVKLADIDMDKMVVTGSSATVLNNYTVTIKIKDTNKYTWDDDSTSEVSLDWQIVKGERSIQAPTALKITASSITLDKVNISDGKVVYGYALTSDVDKVNNWQSTTVFKELDANTRYYFFTRVTNSENYKDVTSSFIKLTTLGYEMIEGVHQSITLHEATDLELRSNAPYAKFKKVQVNNVDLDASMYFVKSGSTVVTLKASYLNTLGIGTYTVSIVSSDGSADTTFIVKAKGSIAGGGNSNKPNTPTTSDSSNKVMWLMMLLFSTGVIATMKYRKKVK